MSLAADRAGFTEIAERGLDDYAPGAEDQPIARAPGCQSSTNKAPAGGCDVGVVSSDGSNVRHVQLLSSWATPQGRCRRPLGPSAFCGKVLFSRNLATPSAQAWPRL